MMIYVNRRTGRTREERRRLRRNICSGLAWLILCVFVMCGAHYVAEHVIVDTPMGIYGEMEGVRFCE